jgi:hypothetical protein
MENDQSDLFNDGAYARKSDPETSHDAAASVDVQKAERDVLNCMRSLGGKAINNEIAEFL